jgi:hypothetical protein
MLNEDYDREFVFDVNQYLIDNYKMTLPMRKSICAQMYDWIDVEAIENDIDSLVADYAMKKAGIERKEDPEEDEKE